MAIYTHKEAKKYLTSILFAFEKPHNIRPHLEVVFVFGSADSDSQSKRKKFLSFVDKKNTQFNFITIESIYEDLKKYGSHTQGVSAKRIPLVELELLAIRYSYSLIIFPESIGSFAELGYFTAIEDTREKIYVVNNYVFSSDSSYVNHLIDAIHNPRELRPFLLDYNRLEETYYDNEFEKIINKLTDDYNESQREIKVMQTNIFPIAMTYEVIRLLSHLKFTQIKDLTKIVLKMHKIEIENFNMNFMVYISLLVVSRLIDRVELDGEIVFIARNEDYTLIDFNMLETNRKKLMMFQIEYSEEVLKRQKV